ncbi:KH domain-containing protein HEN4 [Linum grandiflorum]
MQQPEGGTAAIIDSASENGMASQSQVSEIERCLRFLLPRDRLKAAEAKVPEGGETKETKLPLLRNGFGKSAAAVGPKTKRQLGLSDLKSASLPRLQTVRGISESEKPSTTLKPGAEHDERKKPASVKNETIEVTISAEAISAVYGKDGSNLDQIRKISGAKVAVVDEPDGKWEEVKIVISGTADEAKVAQSLLQASILRGGH